MIAVALSPQARALIRAHRDARRPTAADRERVAAALRARLGATVLPLDTPIGKRLMSRQQRFATACGLFVVGTALFLARRPGIALESTARKPDQSVDTIPSATVAPQPLPTSESLKTTDPVTADAKVTPVAPRPSKPKVTLAAPGRDTLAQELLLLNRAASALSSAEASAALPALEEHERRFSRGILSDERNLAKARALCILQRFDEGQAVLARIGAGTPAAARVKEECDSAWARANR